MRMPLTVDGNVHDGGEECQYREKLAEPKFVRLQVQLGTENGITAEDHEEHRLIDHHETTREKVIDSCKNPEGQEKEQENDEV